MAMQSVFLSVLLTFARTPWYSGYATTTAPWGLDPLTDQQLAGVLMILAGGIYLAVALALLVSWIRATEVDDVAVEEAGRHGAQAEARSGRAQVLLDDGGSGARWPEPLALVDQAGGGCTTDKMFSGSLNQAL